MSTLAKLVEISPDVWVADDSPSASHDGWIVDLGGGTYAIDDQAVGGPPVYIADDGETVYFETVIMSSGGSSGGSTLGGRPSSKGHRSPFTFARRRR